MFLIFKHVIHINGVCGVNSWESRKIRFARLDGLVIDEVVLAGVVVVAEAMAGVAVVDEIGAGESIAPPCVLPTDGAN